MSNETQLITLRHQIDLISNRIHYAESRRGSFVVIATALLAGGIAIIPYALDHITKFYGITFIALSVGFIITSLLIWLLYAKQTNYYPFTDFTRNSKWFYRDVLQHHKEFDVGILDVITASKNVKEKVGRQFDAQYSYFEKTSTDFLIDEEKEIKADQNQIYILHINEKYKNLYLTQLRQLTYWGIIASIMLAVVALVISALAIRSSNPVQQHEYAENSITVESEWRQTESSRDYGNRFVESEYLLNLNIRNSKSDTITVTGIRVYDRFDMLVPLSNNLTKPQVIKPHDEEIITTSVWIGDSLKDDLKKVKIVYHE